MSVSLAEHRLGGLRWIVLDGPDREAFGALGEHVREELAALAQPGRHCPGCAVTCPVRRAGTFSPRSAAATEEAFPAEWAELAAFAAGAGVPFDDLVLLNLRGDLGLVDGGIGCSDLGWRRERSVVAHNEDGALERRRPLRAAHHDRNRTPARHRLLVSRLPAGQRVRPDRGRPDLDGRSPPGRRARSWGRPSLRRPRAAADGADGRRGRRLPAVAAVRGRFRLHDRRPGGPGGERRGRGRPPRGHWKPGPARARCCGTPTTAATSPAPSRRPTARARPAARRWTPSASRRRSPARPGSWTSSPALRRAASAPTPGRTAAG